MRKVHIVFGFLVLAIGSTTLPASAANGPTPRLPVVVKSTGGGAVEVTDVRRIVALNGDVNEIIYALGLGDNIVANDITGYYPAEAAKKPKIGYQRTLSAETILAQKPTLIIGNQDAGPPTVIAQLRATGIPVVIVPSGDDVYDAPGKIRLIANALGVSDVFLYLRGASTLLIGGSGTRANAMLSAAGALDAGAIFADVDGYVPITSEAMVKARPDVIVVLTGGLESVGGTSGVLKLPGVALTPAGQTRNIIDFDDLLLLELGPRTPEALQALTAALYGSSN